MTFARLEYLFLIWAVPALLLVYLYGSRKRARILSDHAAPATRGRIMPTPSPFNRWLKAALLLLALTGLAGALSGPQLGFVWQTIERRGVSLVVGLDGSRSMLAEDIDPSRLERAKREIKDLLDMLEGDKVGLVAFAGAAFLQCPLTLDYSAFHLFLNSLTPDYLPVGGTDLAGAIRTSMEAFDATDTSEKAVILITDGEGTEDDEAVREAAREAAARSIKIFCVGVGSVEGAPIPDPDGGFIKDSSGNIVHSRLAETLLQEITSLTGGAYVRSVSGDMDLEALYQGEIRSKMQGSTLESNRKQFFLDRYQWVLAVAVLALFLDLLIPARTVRAGRFMVLIPALLFGFGWGLLMPQPAQAGFASSMKDGYDAYAQQEYDQALTDFLDAQVVEPDDPSVLYNLGSTYYKLEEYEKARKNLEAGLELLPEEETGLREKSLFNLGNTAFRQNDYDEAIERYEETLELNPENEDAQRNLEFVQQVKEMAEQQQSDQPGQPGQDGEENGDKQQQDSNATSQDSPGQNPDQNQSQDQDQNSDQSQNQDQDQDQDKQQSDKQQAEDQEEQADQQQQPGADNSQEQSPEGEQQPPPQFGSQANATGEPEKPEQNASMSPAGLDESPPDQEEEEEPQAVRMYDENLLNQLKDQPGRALMPNYKKRNVEKNW